MRRKPLSRRTFLRSLTLGSAACIALPPLEAFFNSNGTAYAADGSFPRRFGLFFWGNGILPERWIPNDQGEAWTLTDQLMPLAAVKSQISVLTGMEVKIENKIAHATGPGGLLSGAPLIARGDDYTFAAPSIDQLIAAEVGKSTLYRSLEVGVQPDGKGLSYNGPDSQNPAETNPIKLFQRLFGDGFREPGDEPVIDPKWALRRSVLDSVMDDANQLKKRLGVNDQRRLDVHLESVRELEQRIALLESDPPNFDGCRRPTEPASIPDIDGRPQMALRSEVMTELVTMAYACDLTRVMSYWYSDPLNNVLYPAATAGHHQLTHDEPGDQPQVHEIVLDAVGAYAQLVESLASVEEGEGSVLDHMVLLGTTDVSYGRTHQIDEFPILLAGQCGGALKTGLHYRSATKENTSHVVLSLLRAMGLTIGEFGVDAARVSQGFSEIES